MSRRLHLFLSVLLLGDESGKSGGGNVNQKKESTTAVTTIFHSIKCSEDVVDPEKSKVSDLCASCTNQYTLLLIKYAVECRQGLVIIFKRKKKLSCRPDIE